MTDRVRSYRTTHQGREDFTSVLPRLQQAADAHVPLTVEGVRRISAELNIPAAAVRGAISSYTEMGTGHQAVKVCAGTSCMLSGGAAISRQMSEKAKCEPVYCLGYCDRSPAAMSVSGKVLIGLSAKNSEQVIADGHLPHPAPPPVRSEARHSIVSARLMKPGHFDAAAPTPAYTGLAAALRMSPTQVVDTLLASGAKGRGGAAYPTGRKWQLAAAAKGEPKFVVANGDEGDPGSFVDRELMERDPHGILEGMAICAHAIGATRGVVFIRHEYPIAKQVMEDAIANATKAGYLGANALGPGRDFTVEVVRGMGSYVCGEETALLAAIEGERGEVRPRPPFPVEAGLYGKPTVVDNVETLGNVPWIMEHGVAAYTSMGTADSKGTKALCFNKGFANPGIVEVEFGGMLRDAIERIGGGGAGGEEIVAVLLGGPMGSIVWPDEWDVPICFTAMQRKGINLGHGGLVAIPKSVDWSQLMRHLLNFMRDESCGKCNPCRLGSTRLHELAAKGLSTQNIEEFRSVLALMKDASLCAFGRETPGPIESILKRLGSHVVKEVRS
jgi:NADH:ubiquinone oxidoreductase subunit F (NADH-binding)/NADH:ubiquinone oxidoreductase subunit E